MIPISDEYRNIDRHGRITFGAVIERLDRTIQVPVVGEMVHLFLDGWVKQASLLAEKPEDGTVDMDFNEVVESAILCKWGTFWPKGVLCGEIEEFKKQIYVRYLQDMMLIQGFHGDRHRPRWKWLVHGEHPWQKNLIGLPGGVEE